MSMTAQRHEPPPQPDPLDEGYWSALLHEEEFAEAHESPISHEGHRQRQGEGHNHQLNERMVLNGHGASEQDWADLRQKMEADESVEVTVIGFNRGGLLIEWRTLRGFVPASQLIDFDSRAQLHVRRESLSGRIGQKVILRVIELNQAQNRLILSERAAQAGPGARAGLLSRLHAGQVVRGVVTNLCDFGAFVDLGGLEGLIHISELSWGRVGHPADLLERGQQVECHVLDVNPEAGRIALSMKRLHPDPWRDVQERYKIGEVVHAIITNVVDFGAFARIEEGLEGLIHVSELAEGHFLHPRNVVHEGQRITARILSIDGHARRLGLSLRALNGPQP